MFNSFDNYPDDAIESLFARLAADPNPDKLDLGIGVYRDERGQVPVMAAVRDAEKELACEPLPKSYMTPLGNADYCRSIETLVFGEQHVAAQDGRLVSAQTPGAGAGLRLAAEVVHSIAPDSRVWVSEPVWDHQVDFFTSAGMDVCRYRYYDREQSELCFDDMLDDLQSIRPNDLLLLHGCCHNPTGQDLDASQWSAIADLANATGCVPLIDIAYQGFGAGIDADVEGLQILAGKVPQLMLIVSSSKSFGIYRERAGLLSIMLPPSANNKQSVRRKLRDTARELYFMAPNHGAAIVQKILSSAPLAKSWRDELNAVREHIVATRQSLKAALEAENPGFDASFLIRQRGMFSCLPICAEEQQRLEQDWHIYMLPHARVNVAAMSGNQAHTLARAFSNLCSERSDAGRPAAVGDKASQRVPA